MSLFVTIEGIEGAGKSTLITGLTTALRSDGHTVVTTREPGGTLLGQSIRNLLLSQTNIPIDSRAELLLFAADRAQHLTELILPALASGAIVICDRFTDSTLAYQGAGRGLEMKLLEQVCQIATEGLTPELTILLDLEPAIGLARTKSRSSGSIEVDRFESQTLDFHQRIRQGFLALARANPRRFMIMNAAEDPAIILQKASHEIISRLTNQKR